MNDPSEFEVLTGGDHAGRSKPTVLYRLKPEGLGSAERESLSSFMLRLCHEHSMPPYALIQLPGINDRARQKLISNAWGSSQFDGLEESTKVMASEMALLTGHTSLQGLTMLSLSHSVGSWNLMGGSRKWCPICLDVGNRPALPYGRLLWRISSVTACLRHRIRLVSECQCGERVRIRPGGKRLPHICPHCLHSLASQGDTEIHASEDELGTAQLVADRNMSMALRHIC